MKTNMIVQTELECGQTRMMTYLDYRPELEMGTRLSLKGDDRIWTVIGMFVRQTYIPESRWKVGGLK